MEAVSISLGPSERDRCFTLQLCGERVRVRRIGTDGSYLRAMTAIRELDGKVAGIGLGGINLAYRLDGASWPMPGTARLAAAARRTPLLDGSAFKDAVEPLAARALPTGRGSGLVVSVLDRPLVAGALQSMGYRVRVGDAWFALGLRMFPDPATFTRLARWGMPVLSRLPLSRVYGGHGTEEPGPVSQFEAVWGDLRLLRRRPIALRNVSVVTSSLRRDDVEWLRRSGVHRVITATPPVQGEGYGANVWEAVMAALNGRPLQGPELRRAFLRLVGRVGWSLPFDHPDLSG